MAVRPGGPPRALPEGRGERRGPGHPRPQGGEGTDKLRLRIYGGPGGLLYDNEWTKGPNDDATTALGGGSVQIKAR